MPGGRSAARLLRRWWLLLAMAAIGAFVGRTVAAELPQVYRASTVILVGAPIGAPFLQVDDIDASERLTRVIVDIIPQEPVLSGVVSGLALDTTWQRLQARIHAVVEGRSERLILVTATADSAAEAEAIVREVPRQLAAVVFGPAGPPDQAQARGFIWSRMEAMQRHIVWTQRTSDDLLRRLSAASTPVETDAVRQELDDVRSLLTRWDQALTSMYRNLEHFASPGHLEVVEAPQSSSESVSPDVRFDMAAGAGAGAVIALLIANALAFRGDRPSRARGTAALSHAS